MQKKGGSAMYRYIYVEAQAETFFNTANHRELIDEYSQKGWRLVTAIPTQMNSNGYIKKYDLVFEKPMNK